MLLRNADPASLVDKSLAHSAAACTPRTLSLTISNGRCHGTTIAVKIAARCHAPQTETALASEFFHLKNLHAGMRRGDRPRPPRRASLTLGIGAVAFMAAAPAAPGWCAQRAAGTPLSFQVVGDGIPEPLAGARGDAERGRALLVERAAANCLLCHAVADPTMRVAGNVAPSLDGVGRRLSAAQLRLRVADIQRVNPGTAMPGYYRTEGLDRVAAEYRGKPILDARQIEDIVAYLVSLK